MIRRACVYTCIIHIASLSALPPGEEVWSVRLAGQVIPGQCRISVGRVRAELKLRKAEFGQWTEFTVRCLVHALYIMCVSVEFFFFFFGCF